MWALAGQIVTVAVLVGWSLGVMWIQWDRWKNG